jgi:predicted RNA binding protein YcfA (HicA-like mRNA interferase family)
VAGLPKATKRRDFISRLRELGFTGPHPGVGDHPQYMERKGRVVKLPNPHSRRGDIGPGLLKNLLYQAGISREEWLGGS